MNMNHARITVNGHLKFYNHQQVGFGGGVRLGELTLVRLTIIKYSSFNCRNWHKYTGVHFVYTYLKILPFVQEMLTKIHW